MSGVSMILLAVVFALAFWLIILRPAKARQQAQQKLLTEIEPGARVMTTAGLFATIVAFHDDKVELEIADGVRVLYLKQAIARAVDTEGEAATEPAAADAGTEETPESATPGVAPAPVAIAAAEARAQKPAS